LLPLYRADPHTGRWVCERAADQPLGFDAICDWGTDVGVVTTKMRPLMAYVADAEALADEAMGDANRGRGRVAA
jgi:hypothetical protein